MIIQLLPIIAFNVIFAGFRRDYAFPMSFWEVVK
jgi:hypothetical protein